MSSGRQNRSHTAPFRAALPAAWIAGVALLTTACEISAPYGVSVRIVDGGVTLDAACTDQDDDGVCAPLDCDDGDPLRKPGASEVCDAIDNDCDGEVDEGMNVGGDCPIWGPGGCRAPGMVVCNPVSKLPACALRPEVVEHCNALDDDCDGLVDEGNPGGGGPCDGGGIGACGGGRFQCVGGTLGCLADATPGQFEETCNAVDDDCDGVIDEAPGTDVPGEPLGVYMEMPCVGGPAGTADVGDCTHGTWTCAAGQWSACVGEVRPRAAKCTDTSDSNCNGVADDAEPGCACGGGVTSQDCYTGPAGTEDVGACAGGTQSCVEEVWQLCTGEVVPVAETCNAADDDCDGMVDEDFNAGEACVVGVGACASGGVVVCAMDGLTATCDAVAGEPGAEVCNGADDDCDGAVDEVPGVGSDCTAGVGACQRPGVLVCSLAAEDFVCNATPGVPAAEICNEIDDDCDGSIDEDYPDLGEPCTVGVGACVRTGTYICSPVNGARICDVQPGGPSPEVCDGLDNDCDGQVDEGFGLGNACMGPGGCGPGVLECGPLGQALCSSGPGGSESQVGPEVCNDLDDDCDGLVDETFYGLGSECYGCGSAVGAYECRLDGMFTQCSTDVGGSEAPEEICGDTLDNDCDSEVDEAGCIEP